MTRPNRNQPEYRDVSRIEARKRRRDIFEDRYGPYVWWGYSRSPSDYPASRKPSIKSQRRIKRRGR